MLELAAKHMEFAIALVRGLVLAGVFGFVFLMVFGAGTFWIDAAPE